MQLMLRSPPNGVAVFAEFDDIGVLNKSLTPDFDERIFECGFHRGVEDALYARCRRER